MKKFRWGILGMGRIAHKFAQDLQTLPNAELCAVASRDLARANEFATQYNVANAFGAYEDLVKCPDIDIVYVATPHISHCELSLLCLENKIPVLCEKPFAMNAQEVQKMITAARENNTFLMEAMWTRFLPTTQKLLALLESGTIGKMLSLQADFGFYTKFDETSRIFDKKLGGGSLLDVGIYPAFLSLLLLGKPQIIQAKAIFGPSGIDESFAAILTYDKNNFAILQSSVVAKTPTEALIYGEKGWIKVHGRFHETNPGITLHIYGGEETFFPFEWNCIGYAYEAAAAMRCLAEGKKEGDEWPLSSSLDLIQLLDKLGAAAGISY